jgi:hypothetical protein
MGPPSTERYLRSIDPSLARQAGGAPTGHPGQAGGAPAARPNDRVYIHELIDITGHNRSRYMHHMTANWVPVAIAERRQRCFGVWGTVGSTGRWPQVVNLWELEGWEGLAANFDHELSHASLQDPSLAEWWSVAAGLRSGGTDRIVVPEPWSPTVDDLLAAGVGRETRYVAYAHELFSGPPGCAPQVVGALERAGRPRIEALGPALVGAFSVAMTAGHEEVVIWGLPDWGSWIRYERAFERGGALEGWQGELIDLGVHWRRQLMVDAPLSPLRIGRQPSVEDRRPLSEF